VILADQLLNVWFSHVGNRHGWLCCGVRWPEKSCEVVVPDCQEGWLESLDKALICAREGSCNACQIGPMPGHITLQVHMATGCPTAADLLSGVRSNEVADTVQLMSNASDCQSVEQAPGRLFPCSSNVSFHCWGPSESYRQSSRVKEHERRSRSRRQRTVSRLEGPEVRWSSDAMHDRRTAERIAHALPRKLLCPFTRCPKFGGILGRVTPHASQR
jgi:hypothetical protein